MISHTHWETQAFCCEDFILCNMSLNSFVDVAVDKAAKAAKVKVKSMLGGGGANSNQPSKSGGMGGIGGLFPSAGASGNDGKEKKGGLFGGLLSTPQGETNPGAAGGVPGGAPGGVPGGVPGGAETKDFNSAVDELADF